MTSCRWSAHSVADTGRAFDPPTLLECSSILCQDAVTVEKAAVRAFLTKSGYIIDCGIGHVVTTAGSPEEISELCFNVPSPNKLLRVQLTLDNIECYTDNKNINQVLIRSTYSLFNGKYGTQNTTKYLSISQPAACNPGFTAYLIIGSGPHTRIIPCSEGQGILSLIISFSIRPILPVHPGDASPRT